MGVLGLWNILEPVGHPIKIESLENKTLGVDASIWLYKFIRGSRDKDGHKSCLFNRLLKLRYYRIKPIFIFDGPAPVLKRKTIEKRQDRSKQLAKVQVTAMRLLADQIKNQFPDADMDHLKIQLPHLKSHNLVAADKLTEDDMELFALPPEPEEVDVKPRLPSPDIKPDIDLDIHSQDFAQLPAEVRYEILVDIKESQRKLRARLLPEDAASFSNLQFERLKQRRVLQEKIELCQSEICSMYTGEMGGNPSDRLNASVKSYRVQSDASSTMVYMQNHPAGAPAPESAPPPARGPPPQSQQEPPRKPKIEPNQEKTLVQPFLIDLISDDEPEEPTSQPQLDEVMKSPPPALSPALSSTSSPPESPHQDSSQPESSQPESSRPESPQRELPEPQQPRARSASTGSAQPASPLSEPAQPASPRPESTQPESAPLSTTILLESPQPKSSSAESPEPESAKLSTTILLDSPEPESPRIESPPPESSSPELIPIESLSPELVSLGSSSPESTLELFPPESPTLECFRPESPQPELSLPESSQAGTSLPESSQPETSQPESSQPGPIIDLQQKLISSRSTNRVTNKIVDDAKELLKLFGVPFIDAPGEAEAQCALLEKLKLTQGTITDDSDVWLFGSQNVYRNFFSDDKYVMQYKMPDIDFHLRLNRENLVCLAMLVGSDYTEGIRDVGPVTALEILSEFPGDGMTPLIRFKNWREKYAKTKDRIPGSRTREKLLKYKLPDDFPSRVIFEGYMRPEADPSTEEFSWGLPDLDELREYCRRNFAWDTKKIDDKLLPVMKRLNDKKSQTTIDSFFFRTAANQNPELFRSKRVNQALNKISKTSSSQNDEVCLTDEDTSDQDDVTEKTSPSGANKRAKSKNKGRAVPKKKAPASRKSRKTKSDR